MTFDPASPAATDTQVLAAMRSAHDRLGRTLADPRICHRVLGELLPDDPDLVVALAAVAESGLPTELAAGPAGEQLREIVNRAGRSATARHQLDPAVVHRAIACWLAVAAPAPAPAPATTHSAALGATGPALVQPAFTELLAVPAAQSTGADRRIGRAAGPAFGSRLRPGRLVIAALALTAATAGAAVLLTNLGGGAPATTAAVRHDAPRAAHTAAAPRPTSSAAALVAAARPTASTPPSTAPAASAPAVVASRAAAPKTHSTSAAPRPSASAEQTATAKPSSHPTASAPVVAPSTEPSATPSDAPSTAPSTGTGDGGSGG